MSAKHNDKQEKESTEEDEKQVLLQKYKEMHAAFEAKLITRIANLAAHSSRAALKANLDSNLKKTSAFVRKVKVFSESHKDASLFTDLEKLNLVKFVEEIATSLADAKLARVSDINAAVKFSSIMHQKYDQYAQILDSEILSKLEDLFSQILNPPTDQDNSVASRLRSLMRFYSELSWVGVFQSADKFVSTMRKAILKDDLHDQLYVFCSVMATFLKNSGEEFCDIIPTKQKSEETAIGVDHFKKPEFIKANMKSDFLQSCKLYYEKLCQELKGIFEEIKKQSRINKKLEFYKGSVGDANLLKLKDLADRFERLQQNLIIFADSLDLKIPQYSLKEAVESIEEEKSEADAKVDQSGVFDVSKAIFDDPESRAFYEVLPALKLIIPAVLLEEGGGKADLIGGKLVNKKQPVSLKNRAIDVVIDDNIADTDFGEEDFDEEELNSNFTLTESSSSNSPFDVFLKSLNDVSSKSECDKLAEQFCHLNNKGNKKKLLDFLLNANKFRNDILPFYARIIATLSQCFSVIS
jgi:regulator of nonsense transcripts 2